MGDEVTWHTNFIYSLDDFLGRPISCPLGDDALSAGAYVWLALVYLVSCRLFSKKYCSNAIMMPLQASRTSMEQETPVNRKKHKHLFVVLLPYN